MVVLPFKDSQGGTWLLNLFDFNWSCLCRHAPVKKQTQDANQAKAFAPHQNLGPAISEAAEQGLTQLINKRGALFDQGNFIPT
jgi:hypothetical protein